MTVIVHSLELSAVEQTGLVPSLRSVPEESRAGLPFRSPLDGGDIFRIWIHMSECGVATPSITPYFAGRFRSTQFFPPTGFVPSAPFLFIRRYKKTEDHRALF